MQQALSRNQASGVSSRDPIGGRDEKLSVSIHRLITSAGRHRPVPIITYQSADSQSER
jgi:hypothetical protein